MAKATKKKATAKKSPAKKTSAKTAAKKPAAKKSPAKKSTAAKKTSSRKVAAKKTTARKKTSTASKGKAKSKRTPNAAFMRPVNIGPALQPVVGSKPIPRTEVTKKVWAYIKKNGLQDKKNKRNINADENLKKIFGGKKSVNMFEMTKLVSKHLS